MDMAVHAKLQNIVNLLIEHGAETSALKGKEKTDVTTKAPDISIHDAVRRGRIKAVKQHLAAGTDVNDSRNGWTPLHYAAGSQKEIAELLIDEGADMNARTQEGWAPLHWAVGNGYKENIELLIAKGADVNAKTKRGETPLDWVEEEKHKEIVDLLRNHGGKYSTIHFAAGGGNIETVKEFFAAGTNVNAKDKDGDTPLDVAILLEHPETIDLLRKHSGKTGEELKAEGN